MRHTTPFWRRAGAALWVAAFGLGTGACLYDPDARCRDGRIYEAGFCICPPDTTEKDEACIAKVATPGGLGDACDATNACTDEVYSECHVVADDAGYCTSTGCTSDTDCGGDYYCSPQDEADSTFCKRLPTGLDTQCSSDTDCANLDARYCSISPFATICAIPDCAADSCPPGYSCMDFSMFAPGTPKLCAKPF